MDSPSPYVGKIDLERGLTRHPTGLYRIPRKGMLQILVRNPNRTVVKVFLVPYDVSDMPEWSKTFVRQKSTSNDPPNGLRYAIHIKIASHEGRRVFLHQNIRVVFGHWKPDSSEKMTTVTTPASDYVPLLSFERRRAMSARSNAAHDED